MGINMPTDISINLGASSNVSSNILHNYYNLPSINPWAATTQWKVTYDMTSGYYKTEPVKPKRIKFDEPEKEPKWE